mgnify:CR=1 FL=1
MYVKRYKGGYVGKAGSAELNSQGQVSQDSTISAVTGLPRGDTWTTRIGSCPVLKYSDVYGVCGVAGAAGERREEGKASPEGTAKERTKDKVSF